MSCDKPNIAVVVLDTLRKDSFDNNFEWLNGQKYGNAWSTSHGTIPGPRLTFYWLLLQRGEHDVRKSNVRL